MPRGAAADRLPAAAPARSQEIGGRYPAWLEAHAGALSPEDLARYTRQYDFIQRITDLYERDPGNLERLVGLLQEVSPGGPGRGAGAAWGWWWVERGLSRAGHAVGLLDSWILSRPLVLNGTV